MAMAPLAGAHHRIVARPSYLPRVARFDLSWGDAAYHQETLENLKLAIKATKKLCTLQVVNKSKVTISLEENESVVLTPHHEASSKLLPINFSGLAKALKLGDTIFVGQYLFTGSETTSFWLEVSGVQGDDLVCAIKNSIALSGSLLTLHCSMIHIDLPKLSDEDKDVMKKWRALNKIDFLLLSYTRHAEDVRQVGNSGYYMYTFTVYFKVSYFPSLSSPYAYRASGTSGGAEAILEVPGVAGRPRSRETRWARVAVDAPLSTSIFSIAQRNKL